MKQILPMAKSKMQVNTQQEPAASENKKINKNLCKKEIKRKAMENTKIKYILKMKGGKISKGKSTRSIYNIDQKAPAQVNQSQGQPTPMDIDQKKGSIIKIIKPPLI